jgi:hypothetical protein
MTTLSLLIVGLIASHVLAYKIGWMVCDRKHRHLRG